MTGFGPEAIRGIVPPMTTPFSAAGAIDEAAFRAEARFLLGAGVHGLAVGGSTGEGHALSTEEVRRLTEIAVEEADGRMPVVAGIIVDSTGQAIERGGAAARAGAAALQVTPVHYLFRPDDIHMKEHFREMTEAVDAPVVIYNVVPWTYLSPELLVEIMQEVPGVVGVKQSAGDLKLFADLMATAPDGARIMSAVDALMYPSFALGAHGAIAADPDRRAARAGAIVGRGRSGRSRRRARPARAVARAVERDARRQPAGDGQGGARLPGHCRGPAEAADAGRVLRPAQGDCSRAGAPAAVSIAAPPALPGIADPRNSSGNCGPGRERLS